MNKLFSVLSSSALLAAGLVFTTMAPAAAGPLSVPLANAPSADVTLVRDHDIVPPPGGNPWWRNRGRHVERNDWRHGDRRHDDWRRDSWRYREHYRDRSRSGIYFGLGVVPSYNQYVAPRRVYRSSSSAHVQWCYDRYRSYRAWDNTFQPYGGPRQQCYSPY